MPNCYLELCCVVGAKIRIAMFREYGFDVAMSTGAGSVDLGVAWG
jgi:hypothetical protein